jgi:EAL domain-containing protein (putative c-di-GMP-specific phosphodiesterase class I)
MADILVLDDDPSVLELVSRSLSHAGHEVTAVGNGQAAISHMCHRPYDVAVVDYGMPPPDGLEVLRQLRDRQPGCARILLSGVLELPVIMDAVNNGEVSAVVAKPFDPKELIEMVERSMTSRIRAAEVWQEAQDRSLCEEKRMFDELLRGDHLRLAVQPIVEATERQVVAFEALLRSQHAILDGPLRVLQAAERTQRFHDLTSVVAVRAREWLDQLKNGMRLFINLHPEEMSDPGVLMECLGPLIPDARRVVLEVTERSRIQDLDAWRDSVDRVGEAGFALAVDDLGAGYSSLALLADLEPRYIKMDMSIVRGIDQYRRNRKIAELLCRFSAATDASLIAEGVETPQEAITLANCGADFLQGYLFGRPALKI